MTRILLIDNDGIETKEQLTDRLNNILESYEQFYEIEDAMKIAEYRVAREQLLKILYN